MFWSEIGSGFGEPGVTPLPRKPRSTPPPGPRFTFEYQETRHLHTQGKRLFTLSLVENDLGELRLGRISTILFRTFQSFDSKIFCVI